MSLCLLDSVGYAVINWLRLLAEHFCVSRHMMTVTTYLDEAIFPGYRLYETLISGASSIRG